MAVPIEDDQNEEKLQGIEETKNGYSERNSDEEKCFGYTRNMEHAQNHTNYFLMFIFVANIIGFVKQWMNTKYNYRNHSYMSYHRTKMKDNSMTLTVIDGFEHNTSDKNNSFAFLKTLKHYQNSVHTYVINMLYSQEFNEYVDNPMYSEFSMKDSMKFEWSRLSTFATFTSSKMSAIRLAKAGFHYEGNEDEVVCYFCGLKHKNWINSDDPQTIHKKLSPNCPFVIERLTNGVANRLSIASGSQMDITGNSVTESYAVFRSQKGRIANHTYAPEQSGACGNQSDLIGSAQQHSITEHVNGGSDTQQLPMNTANESVNKRASTQQCLTSCTTEHDTRGVSTQQLSTSSITDSDTQQLPTNGTAEPFNNSVSPQINGSVSNKQLPTRSSISETNKTTSLHKSRHQNELTTSSANAVLGLIPMSQHNSLLQTSTETNHGGSILTSQSKPVSSTNAGQPHIPLSLDPDNMGVCVEKPKYPQYAVRVNRLSSFNTWPSWLTQTPEDLATAGFFYTGIEDSCRCFYCGGGLRRWEPEDVPWTEHARWFSKCPFVMQCKGSKFIDDVRQGREPEKIEVRQLVEFKTNHDVNGYTNNGAVQTIIEFGIPPDLVKLAFSRLKDIGVGDINASLLMETIYDIEDNRQSDLSPPAAVLSPTSKQPNPCLTKSTTDDTRETTEEHISKIDTSLELSIRSLEEENRTLKDQQTCKICLDDPVSIVFLPCGHMAACVNCAPALRRCPICRAFIRGTVKAIIC